MSQTSDEQAKPSPEQIAAFRARVMTQEITKRQIESAVMMARDPHNWRLTPIDGSTRTFYRRVRRYGA